MHECAWNCRDWCALTEPHPLFYVTTQECGWELMCKQSFIYLVSYSRCYERTLVCTIEKCTDSIWQHSSQLLGLRWLVKCLKYIKISSENNFDSTQSHMFLVLEFCFSCHLFHSHCIIPLKRTSHVCWLIIAELLNLLSQSETSFMSKEFLNCPWGVEEVSQTGIYNTSSPLQETDCPLGSVTIGGTSPLQKAC